MNEKTRSLQTHLEETFEVRGEKSAAQLELAKWQAEMSMGNIRYPSDPFLTFVPTSSCVSGEAVQIRVCQGSDRAFRVESLVWRVRKQVWQTGIRL